MMVIMDPPPNFGLSEEEIDDLLFDEAQEVHDLTVAHFAELAELGYPDTKDVDDVPWWALEEDGESYLEDQEEEY